jgi:hypothetical protein
VLAPARVDQAIPWLIPPLHARFLGAVYFSGATLMIGALCARAWSSVRVVVPIIGVWTGGLGVVSLLNLPAFDFARHQTWVWFAAYLTYPLIAAWIAWRMRQNHDRGGGPPNPAALRAYLTAQGIVLALAGGVFLLFPQAATTVWPWAITSLLAQLYGAPILAYGLGSLYAARQRTFVEVEIFLLATCVLAIGVLLASALHLALFTAASAATWVWFLGFGVMAVTQAVALALGRAGSELFPRRARVALDRTGQLESRQGQASED